MTSKIMIGLDGHGSGERALAYATKLAKVIGSCELVVVYVIEWSPYSFQTPEENAERHKRREEEISTAMDRVINPALASLKKAGFSAKGIVRHGHVADTLNDLSEEENAEQIVVGRSTESGLIKRFFGSSTANLVMHANVPVTVVG
ncbi:universal stress protein [Pseudohalocynthiibacter aestuariivivens]|jgi:nucleotide-binding universal stress UspA family protein|uniref:Universal stress protein n=1 Tax=Pseudohalocynthiibacter aestuariivivens TaxID=1591409 RepID=A0ABV5JHH0_9RHOB|nr:MULTISPECIES: universal stress protein [Pseudohalocynthiibacter]MBS9716461.1 universal stress protein [Pseudohalocynthiibacter aestuariivivens]MCK0100730.1 universal stress protein [Pseudohalocynthiibacter sp. F2068]